MQMVAATIRLMFLEMNFILQLEEWRMQRSYGLLWFYSSAKAGGYLKIGLYFWYHTIPTVPITPRDIKLEIGITI
jgi:hypothetical protein